MRLCVFSFNYGLCRHDYLIIVVVVPDEESRKKIDNYYCGKSLLCDRIGCTVHAAVMAPFLCLCFCRVSFGRELNFYSDAKERNEMRNFLFVDNFVDCAHNNASDAQECFL